jgi:hypothetical protein
MSTKQQRNDGPAQNLARLLTTYGAELGQDQVTLSVLSFVNDVNEQLDDVKKRLDEHGQRFDQDLVARNEAKHERRRMQALLWGDDKLYFEGIGVKVSQVNQDLKTVMAAQDKTNRQIEKLSGQVLEQWQQSRRFFLVVVGLAILVFLELLAIVGLIVAVAG